MKRIALCAALGCAGIVTVGSTGRAQILRVTLPEMVALADGAVHGKILGAKAIRIDHPVDGPRLYYTTLTIEGLELATGEEKTLEISFSGGWVSPEDGGWNSEAPAEEEFAVGRDVVAFYKWSDNMGGDFASNALVCAHGGLYTTFTTPRGETIAQGRGEGYALQTNTSVSELKSRVSELAARGR